MALLIFIMLMIFSPVTYAAEQRPALRAVIFDSGNTENSVGILGDEIMEVGDLYENFRVVDFEKNAIVLKDEENFDNLKWLTEEGEGPEPQLLKKARSYFVVRQMREIYEAQIAYLKEFGEGYAPDLSTLIRKGFLADGFDESVKQNYKYSIAEIGETGRQAPHYIREPIFLAMAEPLSPEEDEFFFSIDQLGQVRFAPTRYGVTWGPVWDYQEHSFLKSKLVSID